MKSSVFEPGDIVLWSRSGLCYAYVGVIVSRENAHGKEARSGEVLIKFWSPSGDSFDDVETSPVDTLTKLGTVEEWDSGVYYLLDG